MSYLLPGCAILVDYYSGTLDAHDAYYAIEYTINGAYNGCSASSRDDGPAGWDRCRIGAPAYNGGTVLGEMQWANVARDGDTYVTTGSQTGWQVGRHEYWGWDYNQYERRSGAACGAPSGPTTSSGNYQFPSESCSQETHYNLPDLDTQARQQCNGRPVGTEVGSIHYFPQHQIGCYANVTCR